MQLGGDDRGSAGGVGAQPISAFGKPYSIEVFLPLLTRVAFRRSDAP